MPAALITDGSHLVITTKVERATSPMAARTCGERDHQQPQPAEKQRHVPSRDRNEVGEARTAQLLRFEGAQRRDVADEEPPGQCLRLRPAVVQRPQDPLAHGIPGSQVKWRRAGDDLEFVDPDRAGDRGGAVPTGTAPELDPSRDDSVAGSDVEVLSTQNEGHRARGHPHVLVSELEHVDDDSLAEALGESVRSNRGDDIDEAGRQRRRVDRTDGGPIERAHPEPDGAGDDGDNRGQPPGKPPAAAEPHHQTCDDHRSAGDDEQVPGDCDSEPDTRSGGDERPVGRGRETK
jgi:hypothetical protein